MMEGVVMSNVMRPDQSSMDNIQLFLNTIQDVELKSLLENHLGNILAIGVDQDSNRAHRNAFLQAVYDLIEKRTGVKT
jgi:hypothetical protein